MSSVFFAFLFAVPGLPVAVEAVVQAGRAVEAALGLVRQSLQGFEGESGAVDLGLAFSPVAGGVEQEFRLFPAVGGDAEGFFLAFGLDLVLIGRDGAPVDFNDVFFHFLFSFPLIRWTGSFPHPIK